MAQDPNAEPQPQQQPNNDANENKETEDKPLTKLEEILATREQWEQIKKSLDAVMPIIDQIIRIEAVGNKPNKLKNTKKKKNKQIKDFVTKLNKLPKDDDHIATGMELAEKLKKDLTSEEMGNLNFEIRRFTQSIVKVRKELMEEYKKLKKAQEQSS